jgi:DNA polymerase-3 subunit epsilon
MILIVDCESSDLIKRTLPLSDPAQPWCVQLAAELVSNDNQTLDFFSTHIRADGRKVRSAAQSVHGISSSAAGRSGVSEIVALGFLCGLAAQAKYVVGHGIDFDRDLITSLLMRRGKDTKLWTRPGLESICTMKAATPVCKLVPDPPRDDGGWKWPSLDEASQIILGEPRREGAHGAWDDVCRTRRLFTALRERNLVEVVQ